MVYYFSDQTSLSQKPDFSLVYTAFWIVVIIVIAVTTTSVAMNGIAEVHNLRDLYCVDSIPGDRHPAKEKNITHILTVKNLKLNLLVLYIAFLRSTPVHLVTPLDGFCVIGRYIYF